MGLLRQCHLYRGVRKMCFLGLDSTVYIVVDDALLGTLINF